MRTFHQQIQVAGIAQKARINQRCRTRIGTGERDRAPAMRTKHAHVQRIAVTPMQMTVVIVDKCRAEMQLQIWPVQRGLALQKPARFSDVARQHAFPVPREGQKLRQHAGDAAHRKASRFDRRHALADGEVDVIDQVLPHLRRIVDHAHAV